MRERTNCSSCRGAARPSRSRRERNQAPAAALGASPSKPALRCAFQKPTPGLEPGTPSLREPPGGFGGPVRFNPRRRLFPGNRSVLGARSRTSQDCPRPRSPTSMLAKMLAGSGSFGYSTAYFRATWLSGVSKSSAMRLWSSASPISRISANSCECSRLSNRRAARAARAPWSCISPIQRS